MRLKSPLIALLLAASALTACASTSRFTSPAVPLPQSYAHASAATTATASTTQGDWWTAFGDPRLNALIDTVRANSNDLAAATIRVRRAQLQAGLAGDALRPQVSGGVDASSSAGDNSSSRSYSASLSASYEVDLWGKLGAQRDAAEWEAKATAQDLDATALTLTGTAANLYWQLADQNQRIRDAQASLAYARQVQTLIGSQYSAGAVSGVEVAESDQSVRSQEATLADLIQQRVETRGALTLIMAGETWSTENEPQALPTTPLPPVAAGLPAELLARRPDLRAAELRLRNALSTVDATKASLYPSLSLTGQLGSSSTALTNLISNPIGVLGAGITLPFLNWNQTQLNIKVSQADYEIAVATFRQTLLSAFTDVDNALSARTQLAAQAQSLTQALASATRAEQLYAVRYRAGAVPLRTWLDAQESRRSAQQALAQVTLAQLNNQVSLYQTLGGDTAVAARNA